MNNISPTALVDGLELAVGLVVLILFATGPWNAFWLEIGRQRLFRLRDELFLIAARGDLTFDSLGYTVTREYINGLIRFMHIINAPTIIWVLLVKREWPQRHMSFETAIASIPDEAVRQEFRRRANAAALVQIGVAFVRSPIGWILLLVGSPLLLLDLLFRGGSGGDWYNKMSDRVRKAAVVEACAN